MDAIKSDIDKTYKTCRRIAEEIIRSAHNCLLKTKDQINYEADKDKLIAEMITFHEYIYFFMHMTLRSAFEVMDKAKIEKLQEYIGPVIAGTAIDTYIAHWPESFKEKQMGNFYDGLNDAEMEYATVKTLMTKGNIFDQNTIMYILGKRIADDTNNESNPMVITSVIMIVMDELIRVKFHELVSEASKTL